MLPILICAALVLQGCGRQVDEELERSITEANLKMVAVNSQMRLAQDHQTMVKHVHKFMYALQVQIYKVSQNHDGMMQTMNSLLQSNLLDIHQFHQNINNQHRAVLSEMEEARRKQVAHLVEDVVGVVGGEMKNKYTEQWSAKCDPHWPESMVDAVKGIKAKIWDIYYKDVASAFITKGVLAKPPMSLFASDVHMWTAQMKRNNFPWVKPDSKKKNTFDDLMEDAFNKASGKTEPELRESTAIRQYKERYNAAVIRKILDKVNDQIKIDKKYKTFHESIVGVSKSLVKVLKSSDTEEKPSDARALMFGEKLKPSIDDYDDSILVYAALAQIHNALTVHQKKLAKAFQQDYKEIEGELLSKRMSGKDEEARKDIRMFTEADEWMSLFLISLRFFHFNVRPLNKEFLDKFKKVAESQGKQKNTENWYRQILVMKTATAWVDTPSFKVWLNTSPWSVNKEGKIATIIDTLLEINDLSPLSHFPVEAFSLRATQHFNVARMFISELNLKDGKKEDKDWNAGDNHKLLRDFSSKSLGDMADGYYKKSSGWLWVAQAIQTHIVQYRTILAKQLDDITNGIKNRQPGQLDSFISQKDNSVERHGYGVRYGDAAAVIPRELVECAVYDIDRSPGGWKACWSSMRFTGNLPVRIGNLDWDLRLAGHDDVLRVLKKVQYILAALKESTHPLALEKSLAPLRNDIYLREHKLDALQSLLLVATYNPMSPIMVAQALLSKPGDIAINDVGSKSFLKNGKLDFGNYKKLMDPKQDTTQFGGDKKQVPKLPWMSPDMLDLAMFAPYTGRKRTFLELMGLHMYHLWGKVLTTGKIVDGKFKWAEFKDVSLEKMLYFQDPKKFHYSKFIQNISVERTNKFIDAYFQQLNKGNMGPMLSFFEDSTIGATGNRYRTPNPGNMYVGYYSPDMKLQ